MSLPSSFFSYYIIIVYALKFRKKYHQKLWTYCTYYAVLSSGSYLHLYSCQVGTGTVLWTSISDLGWPLKINKIIFFIVDGCVFKPILKRCTKICKNNKLFLNNFCNPDSITVTSTWRGHFEMRAIIVFLSQAYNTWIIWNTGLRTVSLLIRWLCFTSIFFIYLFVS